MHKIVEQHAATATATECRQAAETVKMVVLCHSLGRKWAAVEVSPTDEVCKVLVVCDHNELEVVLLPPRRHHGTQRVSQAGTVLCEQDKGGGKSGWGTHRVPTAEKPLEVTRTHKYPANEACCRA